MNKYIVIDLTKLHSSTNSSHTVIIIVKCCQTRENCQRGVATKSVFSAGGSGPKHMKIWSQLLTGVFNRKKKKINIMYIGSSCRHGQNNQS